MGKMFDFSFQIERVNKLKNKVNFSKLEKYTIKELKSILNYIYGYKMPFNNKIFKIMFKNKNDYIKNIYHIYLKSI